MENHFWGKKLFGPEYPDCTILLQQGNDSVLAADTT